VAAVIGGADDAYRIATELADAGLGGAAAINAVTRRYGLMGQARVKANASGRPGPRRVTGDYTRSMSVTFERGGQAATIGTMAPQARRLEFGFVGVDSLGRYYNQRPLPHWRPMWEWLEVEYPVAVQIAVVKFLR
jgi:hypothetical protein